MLCKKLRGARTVRATGGKVTTIVEFVVSISQRVTSSLSASPTPITHMRSIAAIAVVQNTSANALESDDCELRIVEA